MSEDQTGSYCNSQNYPNQHFSIWRKQIPQESSQATSEKRQLHYNSKRQCMGNQFVFLMDDLPVTTTSMTGRNKDISELRQTVTRPTSVRESLYKGHHLTKIS